MKLKFRIRCISFIASLDDRNIETYFVKFQRLWCQLYICVNRKLHLSNDGCIICLLVCIFAKKHTMVRLTYQRRTRYICNIDGILCIKHEILKLSTKFEVLIGVSVTFRAERLVISTEWNREAMEHIKIYIKLKSHTQCHTH